MRRFTLSLVLVAGAIAGCGGNNPSKPADGGADLAGLTDTDGGGDDGGADSNRRNFTATVQDLLGKPIAGVMVGIEEDPATAMSSSSGKVTISVPVGTTFTLFATKTGYARTVEQPLKVKKAGSLGTFFIPMVIQADYDAIQKAGGAGPGTGVLGVTVGVAMGAMCDPITVDTMPSSGKAMYVPGDMMTVIPDPKLTSVQMNTVVTAAYVVGASGMVTPTGMSPTCMALGFPQALGALTVLAPFKVESGAYHDVEVIFQ